MHTRHRHTHTHMPTRNGGATSRKVRNYLGGSTKYWKGRRKEDVKEASVLRAVVSGTDQALEVSKQRGCRRLRSSRNNTRPQVPCAAEHEDAGRPNVKATACHLATAQPAVCCAAITAVLGAGAVSWARSWSNFATSGAANACQMVNRSGKWQHSLTSVSARQ